MRSDLVLWITCINAGSTTSTTNTTSNTTVTSWLVDKKAHPDDVTEWLDGLRLQVSGDRWLLVTYIAIIFVKLSV